MAALVFRVLMSIDFGTHGFFASFAAPSEPGVAKPVKDWPNMPDTDYNKNLNAILLSRSNPDNVLGYGYEAQKKYMEAKEEKAHEDMMYFENFKLQLLQGDMEFDVNKPIVAVDGVSTRNLCPLVSQCVSKIVTYALEYYRTHEGPLEKNEVLWVLTVPAIWPLVSREAMKRCCYSIGIPEENLHVVSEPEAAGSYLIWGTEPGLGLHEGDAYMCLDVGGGTYDAVCHALGADRILNEITYTDGGLRGAFDVDQRFVSVLEELVGEGAMRNFRDTWPMDFVELIANFQANRERIRVEHAQKNVRTVEGLEEILEQMGINLEERCTAFRLGDDDEQVISIRNGTFTIKQKLWRYFHEDVVEEIAAFVRRKLSMPELEDVRHLFLVGGFSQSCYVRESVERVVSDEFAHVTVITPHKPELAVARGAIWAAAKHTVETRLLPCTYGICIDTEWKRGDPRDRRVYDPDFQSTFKMENVFHILFEKEDEWEAGHYERFEYGIGAGVKDIVIDFYKSEDQYPSFVDEPGCSLEFHFTYELTGDEVSAHPQTLMLRCELGTDSIKMFVHLRDEFGVEKHTVPFNVVIGGPEVREFSEDKPRPEVTDR